ncbi:MAG: glycosyltransferase [Saprospiraceae bacterium]|nr:glycosyltransferase [Saprospiraceae bacterium]
MSVPFEQILIYIFLFFTLVQFLFIFFADSQLLFYKKTSTSGDLPSVSLIIAAHNELANLQALLPILEAQSHPDFEIIIIDDRSDEETQLWLLAQRQRSPRLKVVRIDQSPAHISPKKYAVTLGYVPLNTNTCFSQMPIAGRKARSGFLRWPQPSPPKNKLYWEYRLISRKIHF